MFLGRIDKVLKGAGLSIAVGAFLVAGCAEKPTGVSSSEVFDTAIELSRDALAPGDSLTVTITVTNKARLTQKLVFGCGFTIGAGLWSDNGEWVAGDQICPTEMVELTLDPGEAEVRKTRFPLTHFSDGHQLPPGKYVARGGLWDLSDKYPWAEAVVSITMR